MRPVLRSQNVYRDDEILELEVWRETKREKKEKSDIRRLCTTVSVQEVLPDMVKTVKII